MLTLHPFYPHDQYVQYGEHSFLDPVEYQNYIHALLRKYQDPLQLRLLRQGHRLFLL